MRPGIIRNGSALLSLDSPKGLSRLLASTSSRGQWGVTPWICQRCYHNGRQSLNRKSKGRLADSVNPSNQHFRNASSYGTTVHARRRSLSTTPDNEPDKQRNELPSQEEGRRSHLSKRFSHVMDHLQSNIFIAGQRLNDLTGYSGIEALKKDIEQQEELVQSTRSSLQKYREDYSAAIAQRSGSQREVNELLQRKHAWTPNDLERFTALYRSDHANEQAEIAAQERLVAVERKAEEAGAKLSACILARYHEEQIWSDKIRRMSTWGTWGLMGVNILLFLVFQIGVEPWRRKRLVKGFEDKVMEALEREGSAGATLAELQVAQNTPLAIADKVEEAQAVAAEETLPELEVPVLLESANPDLDIKTEKTPISTEILLQPAIPSSTLQRIRAYMQDMFSEREIILRRLDLTTAMFEGVAAGVTIVGVIVLVLRPK